MWHEVFKPWKSEETREKYLWRKKSKWPNSKLQSWGLLQKGHRIEKWRKPRLKLTDSRQDAVCRNCKTKSFRLCWCCIDILFKIISWIKDNLQRTLTYDPKIPEEWYNDYMTCNTRAKLGTSRLRWWDFPSKCICSQKAKPLLVCRQHKVKVFLLLFAQWWYWPFSKNL